MGKPSQSKETPRHIRSGARIHIVPRLIRITCQPIESIVAFLDDTGFQSRGGRLFLEPGVPDGPVVAVDQVGRVENLGSRAQFGALSETFARLRSCLS